MIKFENVEVVGFEHAIRGMRNPLNSWNKYDSGYVRLPSIEGYKYNEKPQYEFIIGVKDKKLMKQLAKAGTDHRKFLRMITVYMDITAPLYWWKEFDTYKVGTVANSCSTMHKVTDKEFTIDDFSCEHLINQEWDDCMWKDWLHDTCAMLNRARINYMRAKTEKEKNVLKNPAKERLEIKKYWWQIIQLLPTSYNQKRTVMLNYEVLLNMYNARKSHKLDEWVAFCEQIEALPYFEEICLGQ